MVAFLGFAHEQYEAHGGIADLVTHGTSEGLNKQAVEQRMSVDKIDPVVGRTISVEEQEEQRRSGYVTSNWQPLRPIVVEPQPRSVRSYTYGHLLKVSRRGVVWWSVCTLVDDGDWEYHFEWDEWTEIAS